MAVSLGAEDAAIYNRITAVSGEYGMLDMKIQMMLANMLDTAVALVEGYAPEAPVSTQDEAAARVVGFLWDQSPLPLNNAPQVDPMRMSGAMALLSPYHAQTGATV